MQNRIKFVVAVLASLGICWFAGQQMKAARLERQEQAVNSGTEVGGTATNETGEWNLAENMESDAVSIEGREESRDYPYGYNVGRIEDDEVGEAVFLTPGTSITVTRMVAGDEMLNLSFFLHPWVADGSDGALLKVVFNADGEGQSFVCEVGAEPKQQAFSLEAYKGKPVDIELSVFNEVGQSVDCDWVILTKCVLGEERN